MNTQKQDKPKMAFDCHSGVFQFIRMQFSLKNAPGCFKRALDIVLTRYFWKTCLVYLDDVVMFSNYVQDYIGHVNKIMTTLHEAGMTLKITTWQLFHRKVVNLGHMVEHGQVKTDNTKFQSPKEAKIPTNKTQIIYLLGFCNVDRRLFQTFTEAAHPSTNSPRNVLQRLSVSTRNKTIP